MVAENLYDTQKDWNQTLVTKINQCSAMINQDNYRSESEMLGGANTLLITPEIKEIFNSLEYIHYDGFTNYKGYYKLGNLSGRYLVFVIPELTKERKIYVCRLKDPQKIFDINNYGKIGIVRIDK